MFRRLLVLALIASLPATVHAQFTTFIPPRPKVADSVKAATMAAQTAATDSAVNMQLTNMKTWVDSAAGIAGPPVTAADSLAAGLSAAPNPADSAQFRNGLPAPATASDLPLLALVGAALLALGVLMLSMEDPKPREAVLAELQAGRRDRRPRA
ncbi:MAG: hypothetical protein ACHQWU_02905 [Gemmatimonadales bacterium]